MLSENPSNNQTPLPILLTGDDVAEILKISRSFAYSMMRNGEIPVIRMGRSVRVKTEDLIIFIENNKTNTEAFIH
jgi:excisionase family DNA binding protein